MNERYRDYSYHDSAPTHVSSYLWTPAKALLSRYVGAAALVLEAGCGNGSFAQELASNGYCVSAFDLSESGIELARRNHSEITFENASAYDDLRPLFRDHPFDAVVSLEVIEHLYDPRTFVTRVSQVLKTGGVLILSTPYHGYLKNLVLASTGRLDAHFSALWDGGHIKFWSQRTLGLLLEEMGFEVIRFQGVGRLPFLWKSMIVVARKL